MDGLIAEITERRMYSARLGEVFMLPTSRQGVPADLLLLVGLGSFGQFTPATLRFAVENATRTLLRCRVDDLVTIPMGGGSGLEAAAGLRAILGGVVAAMRGESGRPTLRGITFCERNASFFAQLTTGLLGLSATAELDELEVTWEQERLAEPLPFTPDTGTRALAPEGDRNYLLVRALPGLAAGRGAGRKSRMEMALLTAGHKATVLTAEQPITNRAVSQLIQDLQRAATESPCLDTVEHLGHDAYHLLLPPTIRQALESLRPRSLTVITDAWSSGIPWEIIRGPHWSASRDGNLSRRYATSNISVAKWLPSRREDPQLRFLLVVNPTEDLEGAEREGRRIEALVARYHAIPLTVLRGMEATRERVATELGSGVYDVMHYAGHAFFDPRRRSESGIVCAGDEVLSGRDLAALESLPALAVFSACESARVRATQMPRRTRRQHDPHHLRTLIDRNVSFAEALLRGGIGSYVGTFWPVGDCAAELFADAFYGQLICGETGPVTVGEAMRHARHTLYRAGEIDWANYIHYGEPAFRIKTRTVGR